MSDVVEDAAAVGFAALATIAGLRADAYHLLNIALLDPTRELAGGVIDGRYLSDVRASLRGLRLPEASQADLASSLEELWAAVATMDDETLYHELAIEYARLFIGPDRVVVSPYESLFMSSGRDDQGLLMVGAAAKAVLSTYREAGITMATGLHEPPDHIATELEFMFYLCAEETACWSQADEIGAKRLRGLEHAFAVEHLGRWGLDFCQAVREAASQPFYRMVSVFASTMFQFESHARRA